MPELRILWTALPRAATADHLEVDVFVSPRLGVDAAPGETFTLADFPELETWPTQVADHLTFELQLGPAEPLVPAMRVPLTSTESSVDLDLPTWQRLFPATTRVDPWTRREPGSRPLFSYPADAVTDYLTNTYRAAGRASALEPTGSADLGGLVHDAGDLIDTRVDEERAEPTSQTTGGETIGGGPPSTTTNQGCLQGCLTAPLRWLVWIARWLWHYLTGAPPPAPLTVSTPPPPPISVTPKVVTYQFPTPRPAPVPAALSAVEQHVAATGVTPPAGWSPPGAPITADMIALASAWRFFRRPEGGAAAAMPLAPEEWDFHRRLGALGDYPLLLRRLGIVVRLRVQRPTAAPVSVRVVPSWDGAPMPARDLTPRTRCRLDADRFIAEPRPGSELRAGGLDLTGAAERTGGAADVRLVLVDTDGAVLKLVHTAASLVRYEALRARGLVGADSRPEGLPSLRTAGVAIVRSGRAHALKDRLEQLDTIAPSGQLDAPDEVFADDVVRGFQVEVQDVGHPSAPWRTLCARRGTYHLLDDSGHVVGTFGLADHGYVKRTAATSADAGASPFYVHEALVRWTGWSLVAPRPGRRITSAPGPPQTEHAAPPVPEPVPHLHLATVFRPLEHSLPKLRFGSLYRFRLPWVDLAGNGGERTHAEPASDPVKFRRYEPLAPPALLPLSEYTPGESLEHLVIRSDIDRNAAHYADEVVQPADSTVTYHATTTRHFFPAKVTQQLAEQHGKLDGHPLDESWRISLRADHTFATGSFAALDDPAKTVVFGEPHRVAIVASNGDPAHPEPAEHYAINRHDGTLPTPYLPDPIAFAVSLRGVPRAAAAAGSALEVHALPTAAGTPVPVFHVPFGGPWPEVPSFRLRIAERPGTLDADTGIEAFADAHPPHWDPPARLLTIFLAKGEVAVVPFATVADHDSLGLLGSVDWLLSDPTADADAEDRLRRAIELGCHWMVSPARSLTLVHAVQRPLAPAALVTGKANAHKELGATVATISGRMTLHEPTTGQVTLLAGWTDEIDDGTGAALVKKDGSAVLDTFAVPLEPPDVDYAFPPAGAVPARHELGDTKHRLVRYRLRASTRFREYFPAALAGAPAADGSDGFSRVGHEATVSVPNSAPPERLSLRYVIPSFGWDVPDPPSPSAWTSFTRVRTGGGVRVFVDRPWFTSGPGEQIGVVVARAGHKPPELVSELGIDPTWPGSAAADMTLTAAAFSGGVVHPEVTLEDGTVADVVGYAPVLDVERNQWYADVAVDMAGLDPVYCPFIRLALVRFQPSSVEGASASKAVRSEFAQLATDRTLRVDVAGTDVKVIVRGRGPALGEPPLETSLMLIALEESDDADPDELGWRPVGSTAGPVVGDAFEERLGDTVAGVRDGDGFRWERTVTMPGPRGDRTLRVVVRELELRKADAEVAQERFAATPPGQIATLLARAHVPPRVVYADSVRLA